jgi:bla regulator protein blaR1
MPWNPFLHWQVRRLRLAIEVDCDARVVYRRHTLDATAYAEALQRLRRGGNSEKAIVAMAEQNSSVQLRIRLLLTRQR